MANLKIVKSVSADWKAIDNVGDILIVYADNTFGEVLNLDQNHFRIILGLLNSGKRSTIWADHTVKYFRVGKSV